MFHAQQPNPNKPPDENSLRIGVAFAPVAEGERLRERGQPPFVTHTTAQRQAASAADSGSSRAAAAAAASAAAAAVPVNAVSVKDPLGEVPDTLFSFDVVGEAGTPLSELYTELVKPLSSAVVGGTSCVAFVFGQSGSGRATALVGGLDGSPRGLVQLAASDLLAEIAKFKAQRATLLARSGSASSLLLEDTEGVSATGRIRRAGSRSLLSSASLSDVRAMTLTLSAMEIHCEHVSDLLEPYMEPLGAGLDLSPPTEASECTAPARDFEMRKPLSDRSVAGGRTLASAKSSTSLSAARRSMSGTHAMRSIRKQLSVASMATNSELRTPRRISPVELADSTIAFPKLAKVKLSSMAEAEAAVHEALANRGLPLSRTSYDRRNAHAVIQLSLERELLRDSTGDSVTVSSSLFFVIMAGSELLTQDRANFAPEQASAYKVLDSTSSILSALSKRNLTYGAYDGALLTRMLRPYLGLQSHVAVVGTVLPSVSNFEESLVTLRLLGDMHKSMQHNTGLGATEALIRDKDATIRHLIKELAEVKEDLAVAKETNLNQRMQISHLSRPGSRGGRGGLGDGLGGRGGGDSLPRSDSDASGSWLEPTRSNRSRSGRSGGGGGGSASVGISLSGPEPSLQSYETLKDLIAQLQAEKKLLYETLQKHKAQFESVQLEMRRKEAEISVEVAGYKRSLRSVQAELDESVRRHEAETAALHESHARDVRKLLENHAKSLERMRAAQEAKLSSIPPASMADASKIDYVEALVKARSEYKAAVGEMEDAASRQARALEDKIASLQSELTSVTNSLAASQASVASAKDAYKRDMGLFLDYATTFQHVVERALARSYPVDAPQLESFFLPKALTSTDELVQRLPNLVTALKGVVTKLHPLDVVAETKMASPRQTSSAPDALDLHANLLAMGDRALRAEVRKLRSYIADKRAGDETKFAARVREAVFKELASDKTVQYIASLEDSLARLRKDLARERSRRREVEVSSRYRPSEGPNRRSLRSARSSRSPSQAQSRLVDSVVAALVAEEDVSGPARRHS
ncbi:uncharacterized protein AMSG_04738, partial [Thecamonas trahens ATCC 50062]